jgi:aspartate/methionine/tyrosine aminotransferase
MIKSLRDLGFVIHKEPIGAFYIWADVSKLPFPLNDGYKFSFTAMDNQILCIPGCFFDVNPGDKRQGSRFCNYVRFSFGPDITVMERGIKMLGEMIAKYKYETASQKNKIDKIQMTPVNKVDNPSRGAKLT